MLDILFLKIKKNFLKHKFHYFGKNTYIHYSTRIKNPKYISLGNEVYIGEFCVIEAWNKYNELEYSPNISIGDGTMINRMCHIGSINEVKIGKNCLIGSNVMIIDHSHGNNTYTELLIHPAKRNLYSKGTIIINDRVWIGEQVLILPDVTIGEGAIIGAGSVVTKDIPPYCVAVGNPARVIKKYN